MAVEKSPSVGPEVPVTHVAAFVAAFVVVTLVVSVGVAAATISDTVSGATTVPIMITPALAAIVLRRLEGVRVSRTVVDSPRGTTLRSLGFAVGFPAAFVAVAAGVAVATGLGTDDPGGGAFACAGPLVLFPLFPAFAGVITYGEELGRRGYLLPELTERVDPVPATAPVGVVWALYHFPALYFGARATGLGDPITVALVQMGRCSSSRRSPSPTCTSSRTGAWWGRSRST